MNNPSLDDRPKQNRIGKICGVPWTLCRKTEIMNGSFANYSVDFCWWYWYFAATALLADVPKES